MTQLNNQSDILVAQVDTLPRADNKSDIVTRTRSALAMGLLALSINGTAVAQDKPNTTLVATTAAVAVEKSPTTKDGRSFAKLTEAEVDALSDPEFDAYQKWKTAEKLAKLALADAKLKTAEKGLALADAKLKVEQERSMQLDSKLKAAKLELGLKASQSIKPLLAQYKAGEKPEISEDLRNTLIQIAEGKLPPPDMRALAQELVKYFA